MGSIDQPATARSRRTRAALLDAARSILEAEGATSLTMSAIAERAGVTRKAVYLHFDNVRELLGDLFDHIAETEHLDHSLDAVWDAPDAVSALRRWASHLADYHPRVMAVDRAIRAVEATDPAARAHRARVDQAQRANCERLVAWIQAESRLSEHWDADSAADLLFALISTDLIDRLSNGCGWSRARLADHLGQLMVDGLTREQGSPRSTGRLPPRDGAPRQPR